MLRNPLVVLNVWGREAGIDTGLRRGMGFPGGPAANNLPAMQGTCTRLGFDSWVRKTPWRRKWQPTPVLLPGKVHGQRGLVAAVHGVALESDMTEHTQYAVLIMKMFTHHFSHAS